MSANNTEENKRIVEGMYAAGSRGDFQGFLQCLDENVVVFEPPFLSYGGTYKGIGEFMGLMKTLNQYLDTSTMKVQHVIAEGDRVMGVMTLNDRKTGKPVVLAEQSTLRNGKVVELQIFYHDAGSLIGAQ